MNNKNTEWELECQLRERMRKLANYEVVALLGSGDEDERYVAASEYMHRGKLEGIFNKAVKLSYESDYKLRSSGAYILGQLVGCLFLNVA